MSVAESRGSFLCTLASTVVALCGAASCGGEPSVSHGAAGSLGDGGAGGSGGSAGQAGCGGLSDSGGSGDQDGAAGTGGCGPLPAYCVDVRSDAAGIPELQSAPYDIPRNPFWRDERGIHVVWSGRTETSPRLVVSSYSATDGSVTQRRIYDPYPPDQDWGYAGIWDAAGSPSGVFAIAHAYREGGDDPTSTEEVLLGHLERDTYTTWVPPWPRSEYGIFQVAWDGEAFAIHLIGQAGGGLYLARLSTEGELVLPLTQTGLSGPVFEGIGYISTNPDTGHSVMISRMTQGVRVVAHHRDGSLLPGIGDAGSVELQGVGLALQRSGGYPSAWLGEGGGMAMWNDVFQPFDGELRAVGNAFTVPIAPSPNPNYAPDGGAYRALARFSNQWSLLVSKRMNISWITASDTAITSTSALVTHSPAKCYEGQTLCTDAGLLVRSLSTFVYGDELWLGFRDDSQNSGTPEQRAQSTRPYRVVRVAEGCVYPSMYDALGLGGG